MLRFVEGKSLGMPNREAALYAGYAPKSAHVAASRLIKNDKVLALINGTVERAAKAAGVSVEWVLQRLQENADRCMQVHPVYGLDGVKIAEYQWQPQAANTALQLLGKHLRMFPDSKELTGKDGGPIDMRHAHIVVSYEGELDPADDVSAPLSGGGNPQAYGGRDSS